MIIIDAPASPWGVLAALPETGGYFSLYKIILFALAALLWAHNSAWVDQDTKKIRVRRGPWTLTIFATGGVCIAAWLLVPWFWVGFPIFAILYGAAILSYVVYRNARVSPAQRVLTMDHLRRILSPRPETEEAVHAKDKVRIKDHAGKTPPWPTDPQEHAAFQGVQDLLFDAIWRRCSDMRIDLVPQQPVKVVLKIDGVERPREPIDAQLGLVIAKQLKTIAGLNPEEHRRPQSGRFSCAVGPGGRQDKAVDIEMKTAGSTAGQRIELKLFAAESKFRLSDLGFTKDQLGVVEGLVKRPGGGLIIVSGPPGSGVTSTLYAFLRAHDAFIQNIHTLEITKAIDLENITQHKLDRKDTSTTYAKRFQSILRTDPDVAMACDVPAEDLAETARLLSAAAKTGKRLYLGLAAKDTFGALRKFLQLVEDNQAAAAALVAITCQRLVRIVCPGCRRAYKPDPALLQKANLPTGENRPFYRPPNPNEVEVDKQGNPLICPMCQASGYLGRTAVFELLTIDDPLRRLIVQGAEIGVLMAEARKRGMLYLQEVALHKVYDGVTSINEVRRVTQEEGAAVPVRA